jgi:hypothetical protein
LLFRKDIVTTFSGETVRKFRPLGLLVVGILVYSLVFSGCSGNGAIAITLSASETSLNPGQTVTIIATLTNDRTDQGVTWTLTGPGTLSGNTTTAVVYTAPSTVAVATSATITATSVANTTITATQSVSLTAVLTITTTSLPAGILGVAYDSFINAAGAPSPFTWTIISGSLPPGLTFQTTSTSTSAEITGTPTVLGTSNFTVQVEDSSDAIVTQALSIVINKPPPLSVATGSLQSGTVGIPYNPNNVALQASSGVPPYTWSLAGGTLLPPGLSLSSSGVISGTPIATGTTNFTVQVTDSSEPAHQTATANLSITINPGITNNGRLSGPYAFSVRGFDASGLFVAAGSFTADGSGNISAGIMDINDTTGSFPVNQTFSGTYSVGTTGLGFMTFNIAQPGTGSRTFAFSITAGGNANIIEFDDSTGGFVNNSARNSGVLLKQTVSALTNNYAFGFVGIDSAKNRFGEAGQFAASSNGAISGSLDSDDAVKGVSSNVTFSGTYTLASNGRGTITIGADSYVFYVVNASQLLAIEIDPFSPGLHPLVSGSIMQQSSVSLTGPGVFQVTALDPSGSVAESQVGIFNGSGGSFSMTSDQNTGGTLTPQPLVGTGTYALDTTSGRTTLNLLTGAGFQNSQVPPPQNDPVLYLVGNNQAFIIGTDTAVSFGFMTPQAPPQTGFSSTSLSGTYAGGSLAPADPDVWNVVSTAVAGGGNLTVTANISNQNGLIGQNQTTSTTSVASNGRVQVTLGTNTEAQIFYMVSPGQFVAMAGSGDTTARVDNYQQ